MASGRHLRVLGGWIAHCVWLCGVALGCALAGCATVPDRIAVPAILSTDAVVPGLTDVRVWGDAHFSHALLQAELPRLKAKGRKRNPEGPDDDVWTWLVIALILALVSLTLYGPLLWETVRGSL